MINRKKDDLSEMLTGHKKRSEKRLTRFTVMLIPDSTDMTRSFELTFDQLAKWLVSVAAVILIVVSLLISSAVKNYKLAYGDSGIKAQLTQLEAENAQLAAQKEELNDQLASLSGLLEEKQSAEQQAVEAAKAEAVPTGLPLGVMSEDDGLLAYEIEKDGEAVEPLDLMEIAG